MAKAKAKKKVEVTEPTLVDYVAKELGIEPEFVRGMAFAVEYVQDNEVHLQALKSDSITPWNAQGMHRLAIKAYDE